MPDTVLSRVANALASSTRLKCLPERRPKRRRPKGLQLQRNVVEDVSNSLTGEELLVMDFASLALKRGGQVDGEPTQLLICMRPGKISKEGVAALLVLMNRVLDMPDVYSWFAVTFDCRCQATPTLQLETAVHIMRWDAEAGWQSRCMCQCSHCTILVQASFLEAAAQQLCSWYSFRPPPYCTYLTTDHASATALRFAPPPGWPSPGPAPPPEPASVPPSEAGSAPPTPLPLAAGGGGINQLPSTATAHPTPAPAPEPLSTTATDDGELAASISVGFVHATHYPRKDGRRELLIQCRDCEQTTEALGTVLDYIDRFVQHPVSQQGFSVTYDLRGLRMPSLSMVMHIAAWGNEPERVLRFQRLNMACKVVLSPGLSYTIGKGLLGLFFSQCPPVVRTFVLTHPDEPEDRAVHFDPVTTAADPLVAEASSGRAPRLPSRDGSLHTPTVNLLDVGFASLSLSLPSGRPHRDACEFLVLARSGAVSRDGIAALMHLLRQTLKLQEVSGDFQLVFDMREASKSDGLELVLRACRWRDSLDWPTLCGQRCLCWWVVVQAGKHFQDAHTLLDCFLYLHPPACPVRLVTRLQSNRGQGPSAEWLPLGGSSWAKGGPEGPCKALLVDAPGDFAGAFAKAEGSPPWHGSGLPCSFNAGFLHLSHSAGQLVVQARRGEPTEERLGLVLAYVDDFCHCSHAEGGFSVSLDLRNLRLPSLVTVFHLAIWGAEPARRERWQRLCISSSVLVDPGPAFLLAKGLLSKFFSLSPPVCRTYLLRSPDEAIGSGLSFDPRWTLHEAPVATGDDKSSAGDLGGRLLQPIFSLGLGGQPIHPDDDPWVF